jgi:hypothetical protein
MNAFELQQRRRAKWRLDGNSVRTLEAAAEFIADIGLCPVHSHAQLLAPSFAAACGGSGEDSLREGGVAKELMLRLLRQRSAFEAHFGQDVLLISEEAFPFFYALAGDRNPKRDLHQLPDTEPISPLARDAYSLLQKRGPVSKRALGETLGGALSEAALDRALGELWGRLLITRVDYKPNEGIFWDTLYRWAPELVKRGNSLSVPEGLSALVSKYLDAVVAAEPEEVEVFFSKFAARAKVRESVNALLAMRELSLVPIGRKSMLQLASLAAEKQRPASQRQRQRPAPARKA